MDTVRILRLLRRHALLVALGALVAVLAGLLSTYQISPLPPKLTLRATSSGTASGRVLLSARKEPAFGLESKVAGTLSARAKLLADLMATEESRARIAREAGVAAGELAILGPSSGAPALPLPLAVQATESAALARAPYLLKADVEGPVAIITLKASAPDSTAAARIVDAAAASFRDLLASRSTRTPALLVERLGPPVEHTIVVAHSPSLAAIVAVVLFVLWCAAIVLVGSRAGPRGGLRLGLAAGRPRSARWRSPRTGPSAGRP